MVNLGYKNAIFIAPALLLLSWNIKMS